MRILICDHEPEVRLRLQKMLEGHALNDRIDHAANGIEAIEHINNHTPDLVFIDVNMPFLGGFDIPRHLKFRPLIVFCSTSEGDALPAFEARAFDFLLKPVASQRLDICLDKLRAHREQFYRMHGHSRSLGLDKLIVKKNRTNHVVWLTDIMLFRKEGRYTGILTRGGEMFHSDRSLDDLESSLSHPDYFRVNRATILAKRSVRSYRSQSSGNCKVVLNTGEICPVSRNRLNRFKTWLEF